MRPGKGAGLTPDLLVTLTQFGAAGLIGAMWVVERRAAASRDRALAEAHRKLMIERRELEIVVTALRENTRALAQLEAGQRRIAGLLESLVRAGVAARAS